MKAVTDSGCDYDLETATPGVLNLIGILSACTGESRQAISDRFAGQGYGYLKAAVADAVLAELEPFQAEYQRLLSDPAALDAHLDQSAAHARAIAQQTMTRVRDSVGIG